MRIIKPKTLEQYWQQARYAQAETALRAWISEVKKAEWASSAEIKQKYRSASIINHDRVVFNICGNRYRLIVAVRYDLKIVLIKFFGTHSEYDRIDAASVNLG